MPLPYEIQDHFSEFAKDKFLEYVAQMGATMLEFVECFEDDSARYAFALEQDLRTLESWLQHMLESGHALEYGAHGRARLVMRWLRAFANSAARECDRLNKVTQAAHIAYVCEHANQEYAQPANDK